MKTLVIGAGGQIGRLLCTQAARAGIDLRAMVRHPEQQAELQAQGVETVLGDLAGDFEHALQGVQQVVFTAGSGPRTGADQTLLVDLYGAVRAVDASLARGVKHFIMVSALRAARPLQAPEKLRHYMAAKNVADRVLRQSGLHYTILCPGRLTDEPGTGKIRTALGDDPSANTIPRADVAAAIVALLDDPVPDNRDIDLLSGDTPVSALRQR